MGDNPTIGFVGVGTMGRGLAKKPPKKVWDIAGHTQLFLMMIPYFTGELAECAMT